MARSLPNPLTNPLPSQGPKPLPRPLAIFILVLCATLFAGNHIAARFAFSDGVGLLLAVLARSGVALILMLLIAFIGRAAFKIPKQMVAAQIAVGVLIAAQSVCLYSAITRVPVAMALLLVNTWPMMFILASWALGKRQPNVKTFILLMTILFGLVLVLDISSAFNGANVGAETLLGIVLATLAALFLALTMWLTQYHLAPIAGSVRSSYTMLVVVIIAAVMGVFEVLPGGLDLPQSDVGWWGLAGLAVMYGVAFTLLFVLAPRLDMASNSPMLNGEPVAALFLAYALLGQLLNEVQLVGGAIVVVGIVTLGLMGR
ncbi:MAG: DMT family transporter [Bermanella sp.]